MAAVTTYDEVMNIPRTVSVPERLWALVDEAVARGEARSVSAFVAQALEEATRQETLEEILDDWDRRYGPPSADVMEEARKAIRRER